ncbi:hypothetical protein D3C76_1120520 [compost metagenome]
MMTVGEYKAMVSAYLKSPTLDVEMERRMFLDTTRGKDRFLAQRDDGRYYEPALESEWQGWLNRARQEKQT